MKLSAFCILLFALFTTRTLLGQMGEDDLTGIDLLESKTDKWIQLELDKAKARETWEVEKEASTQHITALQSEQALLAQQLDLVRERLESTSANQAELSTSLDEQRALLDTLEAALPAIEERILAFEPVLPPPLRKELSGTLTRIRDNQVNSTQSVARRLQGILFILTNMERFNNTLTVNREIRQEGDTEYQVEVIYWGLGAGYALLPQLNKAWVLHPTMDGWEWESRDDSAEVIRRAIEIFEKRREPGLITLPVKIGKEGE